jgi:hypothetical protein
VATLYPKSEPPPPPSSSKIYVALTGQVTAATIVKAPAPGGLTITTEKDPGTASVEVGSTPPPNGGTGIMAWLTKLLELWAAIRAGDWLKVIEILSELGKAQAAGQITDAEFAEVEAAMQVACAQMGQPKSKP